MYKHLTPNKRFTLLSMLIVILLFTAACSNKTPEQSRVDDVSDDVYKDLVEIYYYADLQKRFFIDEEVSSECFKKTNDELLERAEAYVEEHEELDHANNAFPNPLLWKHHQDPDVFTNKEQDLIEQANEVMKVTAQLNRKKMHATLGTLKDDLKIEDTDETPFCSS